MFCVKVQDSKTLPLKYNFTRDFTKNFFKSTILASIKEQVNEESRKELITEYISRVRKGAEEVRQIQID